MANDNTVTVYAVVGTAYYGVGGDWPNGFGVISYLGDDAITAYSRYQPMAGDILEVYNTSKGAVYAVVETAYNGMGDWPNSEAVLLYLGDDYAAARAAMQSSEALYPSMEEYTKR